MPEGKGSGFLNNLKFTQTDPAPLEINSLFIYNAHTALQDYQQNWLVAWDRRLQKAIYLGHPQVNLYLIMCLLC